MPQTIQAASSDGKTALGASCRRSWPRLFRLKWAKNPIPIKTAASSKISSRILGSDRNVSTTMRQLELEFKLGGFKFRSEHLRDGFTC